MLNLARSLITDIKRHGGLVGYSTAGSVLQATILPLVILPFLARNLSAAEFGQLAVLLSLVGYVVTVVGGNLSIIIFRNHKDLAPDERRDYFGRIFWLGAIILGLALALALFFYGEIAARWALPEGRFFVLPLLIYMVGLGLSTPAKAFLSADLLFKPLFHARIVYFIFSLAIIGSWYLWPDSFWTAGFAIGATAFIAVLMAQALQRGSLNLRALPDHKFIRSIGGDVALFGIAALVLNFIIYGDRWLMAESGIPYHTVAAYSVAVQAAMLLVFVAEQVSTVFVPLVSNLQSLEDLTPRLARKLLLVMAAMVLAVPVVGGILGQLYIQILYGDAYWADARVVFYLLLVGISFYPIQMLARGFFIRFHPASLTLLINLASLAAMLGALYMFRGGLEAADFAIARSAALIAIGLGYLGFVFLPLWRRTR